MREFFKDHFYKVFKWDALESLCLANEQAMDKEKDVLILGFLIVLCFLVSFL